MPKLTLSDFDYHLPEHLIADSPAEKRDHSKLLVVDRSSGTISHHHFYELPNFLAPNDVLVRNTSKVLAARLHGTKTTGGKVELFLLREESPTIWEAMLRGKLQVGTVLTLPQDFTATLLERVSDRSWRVEFNKPNITSIGEVPLPPYIHPNQPLDKLAQRYQTVYADQAGSVAAPTAGLHFTPEVFAALESKHIDITDVMLHVGLGTFAPVEVEDISQHVMHAEYAELPEATSQRLLSAKQAGQKVVAVGTTSVRTIETFSDAIASGQAAAGWIDTFITPGYTFKTVDVMITNFHLPKSTLLMLVSAFAGKELIDEAYRVAIQHDYRFYSFGDAMLIL